MFRLAAREQQIQAFYLRGDQGGAAGALFGRELRIQAANECCDIFAVMSVHFVHGSGSKFVPFGKRP